MNEPENVCDKPLIAPRIERTYTIRVGLDPLDKRQFYWQILDGIGGCLGDGNAPSGASATGAAITCLTDLIDSAAFEVELL